MHAQSGETFFSAMDCSLPDSSVYRILQKRILEWIAISSYKGSSTKTTESENEYGGRGWIMKPAAMQETPVQFLGQEDPLERG